MNDMDRQILDVLQADFPLSEEPYQELARKLGISCERLIERVRCLIDLGVIRRIGISLDSRKLGYSSTLSALSVPQEAVEKAVTLMDEYVEITHSYLRDDTFNLWFTIIAESDQRIATILEQLREALSLEASAVLNLPVKRLFKLDARFSSAK